MKNCPECGFDLERHQEELRAARLSEEKALRDKFNQWYNSSTAKKADFRKSLKLIPIFGIIVLMTFFLVSYGVGLNEFYWAFFVLYLALGFLCGTVVASHSRQSKKYDHWKKFLAKKNKKHFLFMSEF